MNIETTVTKKTRTIIEMDEDDVMEAIREYVKVRFPSAQNLSFDNITFDTSTQGLFRGAKVRIETIENE